METHSGFGSCLHKAEIDGIIGLVESKHLLGAEFPWLLVFRRICGSGGPMASDAKLSNMLDVAL
jgi:hypothetical protein